MARAKLFLSYIVAAAGYPLVAALYFLAWVLKAPKAVAWAWRRLSRLLAASKAKVEESTAWMLRSVLAAPGRLLDVLDGWKDAAAWLCWYVLVWCLARPAAEAWKAARRWAARARRIVRTVATTARRLLARWRRSAAAAWSFRAELLEAA